VDIGSVYCSRRQSVKLGAVPPKRTVRLASEYPKGCFNLLKGLAADAHCFNPFSSIGSRLRQSWLSHYRAKKLIQKSIRPSCGGLKVTNEAVQIRVTSNYFVNMGYAVSGLTSLSRSPAKSKFVRNGLRMTFALCSKSGIFGCR